VPHVASIFLQTVSGKQKEEEIQEMSYGMHLSGNGAMPLTCLKSGASKASRWIL